MTEIETEIETGEVAQRPANFRPMDFQRRSGRRDLYCRDDGYTGQLLHQGHHSVIIASHTPPRTIATNRHRHASDQAFFVVEGEIVLNIDGEDYRVVPGGALLVPAGVPHATRNDGDTTSVHVEVLAPGPNVFGGIVLNPDEPFDTNGARPIWTAPSEMGLMAKFTPRSEGKPMQTQILLNPANGSKEIMIYRAENPVDVGGPRLHMHTFDQFFFVLKGELTVQIAFKKYHVKARTLVVLPGGIPHTQWNETREPEQHMAILTPPLVKATGMDRPDLWVHLEVDDRD